MSDFKLDRMALDEVGLNPRRLAEAIHRQLGERNGAIPVYEIAQALDIHEIREDYLTGIEAALLTTPERGYGSILVNLNSNRQRRRFSIGHELYHFLNDRHAPTSDRGFYCSRSDMISFRLDDPDRHLKQEAEANAFSIELLAPRARVKPYLQRSPNLKELLQLSTDLNISREAAARRYVELHDATLAAVFCADGKFVYAQRNADFPALKLRKGQPVDVDEEGGVEGQISLIEEVDAADWISGPGRIKLTAQTLLQQAGYSTTLLHIQEQDDDGLDDSYDRFARFSR